MPTDRCECGHCRHERNQAERLLAPRAGSADLESELDEIVALSGAITNAAGNESPNAPSATEGRQ